MTTPSLTNQECRDAFEKWAKERGWDIRRVSHLGFDYCDRETNTCFIGWRAAWNKRCEYSVVSEK